MRRRGPARAQAGGGRDGGVAGAHGRERHETHLPGPGTRHPSGGDRDPAGDAGLVTILLFVAALQAPSQQPVLTEQASGVQATLQAVSPVNDSVVWVSGHAGVILRTLDGGRPWTPLAAPGGGATAARAGSFSFSIVTPARSTTALTSGSRGTGSRSATPWPAGWY